jgi:hypothetical protein
MIKRLLLLSVIIVNAVGISLAQIGTGGVYGTITDDKGEPIPFANVAILQSGQLVTGTTTDFDGVYKIKSLKPGSDYTIKASVVGFTAQERIGVVIKGGGNSQVKFEMSAGVKLDEVQVVAYVIPLIEKDGGSNVTISGDDIAKMPSRGAAAAVTTVAGVQDNDGAIGSVKGSRSGSTDTYIDGVKVRGGSNLPQAAIAQVTVQTGGIPAQFGDITGGVISITTKGASRKTYGGIELVSSGGIKYNDNNDYLLDPQGYHLIAGNVSGPLISIKDKSDPTGKTKKPIMGYFLAGEVNYIQDPRPSAIGAYYVKQDVLDDLRRNPIVQASDGSSVLRSELVRQSDLEWTAQRKNVRQRGVVASGNLDFYLPADVTLKIGGNLDFNDNRNYSYASSLFNFDNNGEVINKTWRVYGRFTQRFTPKAPADGEQKKKSGIGSAYYSIQADYSSFQQQTRDDEHKDELFRYGYVGKFTTFKEKTYAFSTYNDPDLGVIAGLIQGPDRDTLIAFEGSDINPNLSAYTQQYYDLNPDAQGNYRNLTQIEQDRGAIRNGDFPASVYGLWNNTGTQYNSYSKLENTQFRVMATGSFDIGKHSISLGFEYEQRKDAFVGYSPYALWEITRQYANSHLAQQDTDNGMLSFDSNGIYTDTVSFNPLYTPDNDFPNRGEGQFFVDYNIREALGLDPAGTDWIDIDSYDPDFYDIGWFSADELLNNGSNFVDYYGFDHTGKKLKSKPTFDDFFTERDEFGNFTRKIGAFEPIYMAGYIQDEFTFKDLIFRVGVRVDRFDANQKVLKDPFLLYEAYTAGEISTLNGDPVDHPGNIGSSAVVYVNDIQNPSAIVGYREGAVWFDGQGTEISDPSVLRTGTGIAPYLIDPDQEEISSGAFKDYAPQVNVMPRISFSFPISDNALFYANYDVLTQRPSTGNRLDLIDYLFLENRTDRVNNPNLKPETTIEYAIGFKQTIGKRSAIELNAFYREMRNQIATIRVTEAYPRTYTTLGNLDFGTVKGLTVSYDLRRTKNLSLRLAYTLQFADGTGSSVETGVNLVNAGFGNLRVIQPLDFDQRHNIVVSADYRFGNGKNYNGPKTVTKGGKTINWLQNFGVNAIIRAGSGNPYSRQSNVTGTANGVGSAFLEGSINGSSRPWQFRVDMRVDKDVSIKWTKGTEGKPAKRSNLNIYVDIQNLLNTQNILSVYRKTGNPSDDGYLGAAQFQPLIQSQTDEQSFRDLYAVAVNSPFNYSQPRRIRLGLLLNF